MSERTNSQAACLEEIAAAMEQITTSVVTTAENSKQSEDMALTARKEADRGANVVGKTAEKMGAIEPCSDEIATVTSLIGDIAFQTNLLALNAGVEAAPGRGRRQGLSPSKIAMIETSQAGFAADTPCLLTKCSQKPSASA